MKAPVVEMRKIALDSRRRSPAVRLWVGVVVGAERGHPQKNCHGLAFEIPVLMHLTREPRFATLSAPSGFLHLVGVVVVAAVAYLR